MKILRRVAAICYFSEVVRVHHKCRWYFTASAVTLFIAASRRWKTKLHGRRRIWRNSIASCMGMAKLPGRQRCQPSAWTKTVRRLRQSRIQGFRRSEGRSVRLPVGLRAACRKRRRSVTWTLGFASSMVDGMNCRSRSLRRERQLIPSGGGFSLMARLTGLFVAALHFDAPVVLFSGICQPAKFIGTQWKRRIRDFFVLGYLRAYLFPPGKFS